MGAFLALIPLFSTLIDRIFPDKEKADEAKIEMQRALNEANSKIIESQKDIITTEIGTGGWASQWRAYLMMCCTALIAFNWLVAPLLNAFLRLFGAEIITTPIPTEAWTLVTIGIGGYVGKETMGIYTQAKYGTDDKRFFDILRQKIFKSGMSQDQVDALQEALKARDGNK